MHQMHVVPAHICYADGQFNYVKIIKVAQNNGRYRYKLMINNTPSGTYTNIENLYARLKWIPNINLNFSKNIPPVECMKILQLLKRGGVEINPLIEGIHHQPHNFLLIRN